MTYALLACFIALFSSVAFPQRVITTVAGTDFTFPTEPRPAREAPLGKIDGVATDRKGNLYITDPESSLVYKVTPDGTLTVLAGNGIDGYSGDGGPATSASLSTPSGIAVDADGNVYFSDTLTDSESAELSASGTVSLTTAGRIRRVSPDGIITTVAGGGDRDPAGGGPAAQARLSDVAGIALDAQGNLYFAEVDRHRILKVTRAGTISIAAGNGVQGDAGDGGPATLASLDSPSDVALDPQGSLIIADSGNEEIRKVTPDGVIHSVLFDSALQGVAVDPNGAIYSFTFFGVHKLTDGYRSVTADGFGPGPFAGDGGPAEDANVYSLGEHAGLAFDAQGNLYIADQGHQRVRRIGTDGVIQTLAGNGQGRFQGDGGPATRALLNQPTRLTADSAGTLYIFDYLNCRIRSVGRDGVIQTFAGTGSCFPNLFELLLVDQPAAGASVGFVQSLAIDSSGTIYFSTFHQVKKITPDGRIRIVVNRDLSTPGFSGDGGPAIDAKLQSYDLEDLTSLLAGLGLATDSGGNLYIADVGNHRIRKVTPDGTITTIAGTGRTGNRGGGYSGDGGPATQALLNYPSAVAVDTAGNLFIHDTGNHRIRKVTPDGRITTVAGNGRDGYSGDGGPATAARVGLSPVGSIALDEEGSLYIANPFDHRVRRVAPNGVITNFAGTGNIGFSGDGGLAEQATITYPLGLATDPAGNVYISDIDNNRVRRVLPAPPSLQISTSSLSLAGQSGGSPTSPRSFVVSSSVPGVPFVISAASDGGWLSAGQQTGAAPQIIEITANPFGLNPGVYQGAINIHAPNASPAALTLSVTLTVEPGAPPKLGVDKERFSFTFPRGASRGQNLNISNAGGRTLDYTARARTNGGGNWLSVSAAAGKASAIGPDLLTITANSGALPPGTYTGAIEIASATTGESRRIPVAMTISGLDQSILLSQAGLSFTAVAQGGVVPPQTFAVLNPGRGVMTWSVTTSALTGSPNWLSATPGSGVTDAASAAPAVEVRVNAAGLAPGGYYGQVRVESRGAANTPQIVTVFLEVLPPDSSPGAEVQPNELIFTGVAGEPSPGSKDVLVYGLIGGSLSFHSTPSTESGGRWFANIPADAALAPERPTRIVVQPLTGSLPAGVYRGSLSLQFSDGRVRKVSLIFVVSGGAAVSKLSSRGAGTCVPGMLLPAVTTLGPSFTAPAGWPVAMDIDVKDDCGEPMNTGVVVATFSNGDAPLALRPLNNGRWQGTWQTGRALPQVTIKIDAERPETRIHGSREVTGGLRTTLEPPVIQSRSIVSAASPAPFVPLAPGGVITILGERLAEGRVDSPPASLLTELAGTEVLIAGRSVPLFFAAQNQINGVVPYDIEPNTSHQVLVRRGPTISLPVSVDVAATQPAIFVNSQIAPKQGMIYVVRDSGPAVLAEPKTPAKSGDRLVIYCAGLGAVEPATAAGLPPGNPAPKIKASDLRLTIGGIQAPVSVAGLAPNQIGVYQISASLPSGVSSGGSVSVSLTVEGQTSPDVTMAVQ
jgi:uncharacterized protein (TIGR03437 family)